MAPCPPALFSLGQPHCARGVRAVCRPGSTPARVLPTLTPPLPALLQEFCLCGAPRAHRLAPLAATAGDPLIAAARAAAGVLSLAPLGRSDWPPLQRQRASPRCPCPLIRRLLHASIADRYLFAFAISSCGGLLALVLHVVLGRCLGGEVRGGEVSRLAGRDTTAGQPVHQMSAMDACHHAFHAGSLCPKAGEPHSLREVLSFERLVGAGRSRPIGIIAYYHIISIRCPHRGSWPKEAARHA